MIKPLASIIIPSYNRAHYIGDTLDSIIAQSFSNWECIIIDDGSTDNTEEILKSYLEDNRFSYHKRTSEYKPGGNGARNMGFDLSKGKYIKWFDSDDLMHPELLNLQLKEIEKYNYDFVSCKLRVFKNDINNIKQEATNQFNNPKLHYKYAALAMLNGKLKLQTNCPLWKKDFLLDHKLFDDRLYFGHENDFNFRILLNSQSKSYKIINKHLVYLRREKKESNIKNEKLNSDPKIITSIYVYYENVFNEVSKIDSSNNHYELKDKMINYALYRMIFQYVKLRKLDKKLSLPYLKKIKKYLKKTSLSILLQIRLIIGLQVFNTIRKGYRIIHVKSLSLK